MRARFLVALIVVGLFGWAQLQAGSNLLEVTCKSAGGTVVEKARVYIQAITTGKMKDSKVNKQGIANFKGLDDDVYRVWAKSDGFVPVFKEFLHLSGGKSEKVELVLEPGDSSKVFYFEDPAVLEQSNQLSQEGVAALNAKRFDEAEAKFKACLEINPSSPNCYHNLAITYLQQEKWDIAEPELRKEAELLKIFMVMDEGMGGQNLATYGQQLSMVQQILEQIPLQEIQNRAQAAMNAQKYDEAVAAFEEMAKAQPDNAGVYYNIAIAYVQARRFDEADKSIDKALAMKPDDQLFKDLKANVEKFKKNAAAETARQGITEMARLNKEEKYQEALVKGEATKGQTAADVEWYWWLETARAHKGLEQLDQAVSSYQQAAQKSDKKAEVLKELGDYLSAKEAWDKSLPVFKEVFIATSVPVEQGMTDLGRDLQKRGKREPAKKAFEEAIATNPEAADAYYELGMLYFYDENNFEKAAELLGKYVEIGKEEAKLGNANSVLAVIRSKSKASK